MGQCQHYPGKSAEEFIFDNSIQLTSPAKVPLRTKVLRHFPPPPRNIAQIDQELGQLYPRREFLHTTYCLPNNNIYTGQWKDEKMLGIGKMLLPDGTLIISDFLNNQLNGYTRVIKPNGDYFDGKIDGNNGSAFGVIFENGNLYEGNILYSKPHGQGKENGHGFHFEGLYVEGKKRSGVLQWNLEKEEPYFYEGSFQNDLFTGKGRLKNGEGYYVGDFQHGERQGVGIMTFQNGEKYEGSFKNNMQHGVGRLLSDKSQVLKAGLWVRGKFSYS